MPYKFEHSAYLTDHEVKALFDRVVAEGLYEHFFHSGQCKTANDWLSYVRAPGTWMFRVLRNDELVAFAMLDNFSGRAAWFHHCHFRAGWRHTKNTAKACLLWLADALDGYVSTLVGITPASNKLAVKYAEKCGFEVMGTLPHLLNTFNGIEDAVISKFNLEALR